MIIILMQKEWQNGVYHQLGKVLVYIFISNSLLMEKEKEEN